MEAERIMARAFLATPFSVVARLEAAGVPRGFVGELVAGALVAAARVDVLRGGRFQVGGPDGRLLLGVTDAGGTVIDVVALSSTDENDWALLTGLGDMLGEAALDDIDRALATERPARLRLHATPWDWLRAGGEGVCVLEWSQASLARLRSLGERVTLEVESRAMRDKLKALLARGGLPMVATAHPALGRAA